MAVILIHLPDRRSYKIVDGIPEKMLIKVIKKIGASGE